MNPHLRHSASKLQQVFLEWYTYAGSSHKLKVNVALHYIWAAVSPCLAKIFGAALAATTFWTASRRLESKRCRKASPCHWFATICLGYLMKIVHCPEVHREQQSPTFIFLEQVSTSKGTHSSLRIHCNCRKAFYITHVIWVLSMSDRVTAANC